MLGGFHPPLGKGVGQTVAAAWTLTVAHKGAPGPGDYYVVFQVACPLTTQDRGQKPQNEFQIFTAYTYLTVHLCA